MKFSLQFLLALTLLSALAVNGWLTRNASLDANQKVERLVGESQIPLTASIEGVAAKRDLYDRYLTSYDQALEKIERLKDDFRVGSETVVHVPEEVSGEVYATRLPDYWSPESMGNRGTNRSRNRLNSNLISEADFSFVVHVPPKGGMLEVRQTIRARDLAEFSTKRTLQGAEELAAVWPWAMELPPGKSTIRLVWERGEPRAVFAVNGQMAFEFETTDDEVDLKFANKKRSKDKIQLFTWRRNKGSEFETLSFSIMANEKRQK